MTSRTMKSAKRYRAIIIATAVTLIVSLLIVSKLPASPVDQKSLREATLQPETETVPNAATEPPQMMQNPIIACDLDYDGDCDEGDEQIFADALGKCRGEPGYSFDADIDGDGCVVANDEQDFSNYLEFVNEAP